MKHSGAATRPARLGYAPTTVIPQFSSCGRRFGCTAPGSSDQWRRLWDSTARIVDAFHRTGLAFIFAQFAPVANPTRLLTQREAQIAELMSKGHSNKFISHHLGISPSTVSTHISSIRGKLGVTSAAELVRTLNAWQIGPYVSRRLCPGSAGTTALSTPTSLGLPERPPDGLTVTHIDLESGPATMYSYPARCGFLGPLALTPALESVARMLFRGLSYESIARSRGCSTGTVRKQVEQLYRIVGVHSRIELALALDSSPSPAQTHTRRLQNLP